MTPPRRVFLIAINLLNRVGRRRRVLTLFSQLQQAAAASGRFKISTAILEACDGVTQSLSDLKSRYDVTPYPNWALSEAEAKGRPASWRAPQISGGIASSLSHLDAIDLALGQGHLDRHSASEPAPILLVAEDDISIFSSASVFLDQLGDAIDETERLVPDWDMLLFGASESRVDIAPPVSISDNLQYAGFSYLTTLNAVSRSGAEKFRVSRAAVLRDCLVFDELHNALAGLTFTARPDIASLYQRLPRLVLLSVKRNLARQEPRDCIHDTEVSACSRRASADTSNGWSHDGPLEQTRTEILYPYRVNLFDRASEVIWWRRTEGLDRHELESVIIGKEEQIESVTFGFLWDHWGGQVAS